MSLYNKHQNIIDNPSSVEENDIISAYSQYNFFYELLFSLKDRYQQKALYEDVLLDKMILERKIIENIETSAKNQTTAKSAKSLTNAHTLNSSSAQMFSRVLFSLSSIILLGCVVYAVYMLSSITLNELISEKTPSSFILPTQSAFKNNEIFFSLLILFLGLIGLIYINNVKNHKNI